MKISFQDVVKDPAIKTYIQMADQSLIALGFSEHSFTHVSKVAQVAAYVLEECGYDQRKIELVKIAAYLHDIGNVINRIDHAQSGAVMAFRILDRMGADPEDIATIITAIGNHDESTAHHVNAVAAALILGDKTDVRYTRVRNNDIASFDIHDRVNYSVRESKVYVERNKYVELHLTINTDFCPISDYFEIFLGRMILCKKAAEKLGLTFRLVINGQKLM